jgi:type III restriction enzyme
MKLRFKHQAFQADAANAVCEMFGDQPFRSPTYMIGSGFGQTTVFHSEDYIGFIMAS